MIKLDIVNAIAQKHGLTVRQAIPIVQTCLDEIIAALIKGETVELRNFGIFKTKKQKPRTIILPPTGEIIKRPAKTVILFETSAAVKAALNKPQRGKTKKVLDDLIKDVIEQQKKGKTIDIQKFAKKHKIKLPKPA